MSENEIIIVNEDNIFDFFFLAFFLNLIKVLLGVIFLCTRKFHAHIDRSVKRHSAITGHSSGAWGSGGRGGAVKGGGRGLSPASAAHHLPGLAHAHHALPRHTKA